MHLPRFHLARAASLLLPLVLLGTECGPRAGVAMLEPGEGAVLLAPDVAVSLLFVPPLRPGERVRVDLEAGLDAPAGSEHRDLSADLAFGGEGRRGTLSVRGLPPGRSRLWVQRGLPASDRVAGATDRRPTVPPVGFVLDRGGFFPDTEGPFGAGLRTAVVSRTLVPGFERQLEVFVWFPTRDTGEPDPLLHAVPGAALAPDAADLPALVFSHGNCGLPTNYALLLARLARAGWLAAATTHPGNTRDDPGCDTFPAQIQSLADRPLDLIAVVDWLLAESADPGSPLAGAVDPARIALGGHSFGALATLRTVPVEPRAGAALLLAPVYAPLAAVLASSLPLPVPTMLQVGGNDTTTPPATDARPLYDHLAPPRFLVELAGAGHPVFEDVCAVPSPGVCPAGGPERVARFALGFLGRYTAHDLRWRALLAPLPEASLTADF